MYRAACTKTYENGSLFGHIPKPLTLNPSSCNNHIPEPDYSLISPTPKPLNLLTLNPKPCNPKRCPLILKS